MLGATITLHPCADGVKRYLTAEVTGNYAGLLRLAIGKNKDGGGQGFLPSLLEAWGFDIQRVARIAGGGIHLFICELHSVSFLLSGRRDEVELIHYPSIS